MISTLQFFNDFSRTFVKPIFSFRASQATYLPQYAVGPNGMKYEIMDGNPNIMMATPSSGTYRPPSAAGYRVVSPSNHAGQVGVELIVSC